MNQNNVVMETKNAVVFKITGIFILFLNNPIKIFIFYFVIDRNRNKHT